MQTVTQSQSTAVRDTAVKKILRLLSAACFAVDVRVSRFLAALRHGRSDFELRGSCNGCGACCQTPSVALPPVMYHLRLVRRMVLWWQTHVNCFVLLEEDPRHHLFVFRCSHYDPQTHRCRSYRTRPGMCRDYPRFLLTSANPEFLEGCGYYAHYRHADAMRDALADCDLPEEKMNELEERLHLRD